MTAGIGFASQVDRALEAGRGGPNDFVSLSSWMRQGCAG
jgi:hypothetical protein